MVYPDRASAIDGHPEDIPGGIFRVAVMVRMHMVTMLDVYELLKSTARGYNKKLELPTGIN